LLEKTVRVLRGRMVRAITEGNSARTIKQQEISHAAARAYAQSLRMLAAEGFGVRIAGIDGRFGCGAVHAARKWLGPDAHLLGREAESEAAVMAS